MNFGWDSVAYNSMTVTQSWVCKYSFYSTLQWKWLKQDLLGHLFLGFWPIWIVFKTRDLSLASSFLTLPYSSLCFVLCFVVVVSVVFLFLFIYLLVLFCSVLRDRNRLPGLIKNIRASNLLCHSELFHAHLEQARSLARNSCCHGKDATLPGSCYMKGENSTCCK